jgi:hypothetical protein
MIIVGIVLALLVFVGHKLLDRVGRHLAVVARLRLIYRLLLNSRVSKPSFPKRAEVIGKLWGAAS